MMTPEDLRLARINPEVAREAFDQACTRLSDILDTKKSHEQKAFALFSGYLTLNVGIFAAGVALLKDRQDLHIVVTLWASGAIFIVGASLLVLALLDSRYGALGSDPQAWLSPGVIDGNDEALPLMLAYLTYQYQDRIDQSALANERKARWIRAGVFVGMAAPFAAMPCLLLKDEWLKARARRLRPKPSSTPSKFERRHDPSAPSLAKRDATRAQGWRAVTNKPFQSFKHTGRGIQRRTSLCRRPRRARWC